MRKLLLSTAIVLPLASCSFITDFNIFEAYKNWCQDNWGDTWFCEVSYAQDNRSEFLSHDHERERRSHQEHESNGKENGYD